MARRARRSGYGKLAGRVASTAGRAVRWELRREARASIPGMIYGRIARRLPTKTTVVTAGRGARRGAGSIFRYGISGPGEVGYGAAAIAAGVSKMVMGGGRFASGAMGRKPTMAGKGAITFFSGARHFRSGVRHMRAGLYRTSGRRGRGRQIGHPFYGNQYVRVTPRGGLQQPTQLQRPTPHLRPSAYKSARRVRRY